MYRKYIIPLLAIIIFLVIVLNLPNRLRNSACDLEKRIRDTLFYGIVLSKYIDANNHGYEMLKIKNFDKSEISIEFNNDRSGFYDFVKKGDTLFKKKGSIDIQIFNDNRDTLYSLDYFCEDSNK